MKKLRNEFAIGCCYIGLVWFITSFLNGFHDAGSKLYEFQGEGVKESLLIQVVLWALPNVLICSYLASSLFRNYTYTFAYYFVRSRDSVIWLKQVLFQMIKRVTLFAFMKLAFAMLLDFSIRYLALSFLELTYIMFVVIFIFIILLVTNNEKFAMLGILFVLMTSYLIFLSGNEHLIALLFWYRYPLITIGLYSLMSVIGIALIGQILKKKEYYY